MLGLCGRMFRLVGLVITTVGSDGLIVWCSSPANKSFSSFLLSSAAISAPFQGSPKGRQLKTLCIHDFFFWEGGVPIHGDSWPSLLDLLKI